MDVTEVENMLIDASGEQGDTVEVDFISLEEAATSASSTTSVPQITNKIWGNMHN